MTGHRARLLLVLTAAVLAVGCTTNLRISMGPGSSTEPQRTGEIDMYPRGAPGRPYTRIGRISVPIDASGARDPDAALDELQRRALAADADALIDIVTARSRVSGTMIRYVNR